MADVFLSYSQRDRRRVQSVIRALEAAGLSVWWDRRILGGSEFSKEIRDALDGAAAVVVLWSERSVTSSWVLDEAVRGRDTGRLVPASLDGTEPPLGFGQLHTVDLSKRFRSTGALGELVEAVLAKVARPGAEPPLAAGPRFRPPRGVLLAAVAAAVLALAAAAYLLLGESAPSDRFKGGTVAIEHFEALTPDRQSELAARLVEQSVERIFATNFIETVTTWTAPKTALAEADFGLRGTIDREGDSLRATVDVIDPKSGRTLWSSASSRKASEARQLGDQLAISVADILRCAIYTKRRIPQYSSPELFSRILRICEFDRSGFSQIGQGPNLDQALIEIAPKSAQAHALLANDLALQTGDESSPADLARVRAAIASTLALDPDNGAVRWAMAKIGDPAVTLAARERFAREGLRLDPDFMRNKNLLGNLMLKVGRIGEGRGFFRQFVDDYPLDYQQRGVYAYLLAEKGDLDAARAQFDLIEKTRPDLEGWGPLYAVQTELLYGDPTRGKRWLDLAGYPPETRNCLLFALDARQRRAIPAAAAIDRACASSPVQWGMIQALFGHNADALAALDASIADLAPPGQFGPHWVFERGFEAIRRDPRLIAILATAGIPQYWLETGNFPDFCARETLPYDCRKAARTAVRR
ncbi:MAG TPA: TIR domain-containing protein [Sphingomicrobium sp.]